MTHSIINLAATVVRSPEQVSGNIDAEAVLLSIENGKYYQLSAMGTHIWSRIETPIKVSELIEKLLTEFDVERATCETEVLAFLSRLQGERLLKVEH